jgi:hypothetical protein
MGCCVLVIALIGQLFALRRKVRQALGLPVGDWYDDAPQPGLFAVWGPRARGLLRSATARAVLTAAVCGELTFVAIAAPGSQGLIAEHRLHARQAWEYVKSFGVYADVRSLWCATVDAAANGRRAPL